MTKAFLPSNFMFYQILYQYTLQAYVGMFIHSVQSIIQPGLSGKWAMRLLWILLDCDIFIQYILTNIQAQNILAQTTITDSSSYISLRHGL